MRNPKQVLVLPYRHGVNGIEYAIFKRSDLNVWQGIAGGVEEGETYIEECKRESNEEAGISYNADYMELDSKSTIPVNFIYGNFFWGENIFNAIEYCFAVCVDNFDIVLSDEHKEYRWVSYEVAFKMLKWDSNRNALWELNERIKLQKKYKMER